MELYINIAIIILCLSVTVLCWYLIAAISKSRETLTRVGNSIETVEHEIVELNARLAPVIDDINTVTGKIRSITENIDTGMDSIKNTITVANDIVQDIREFEQRILRTVEDPLTLVSTYGKAAIKGVKAFIDMLRGD